MKNSVFAKAGFAAACLSLLTHCSYDLPGHQVVAGVSNAAPGGAPAGSGGSGDEGAVSEIDPAAPREEAPALKPVERPIPPSPRSITAEEFLLTIDASGVASVAEVPVHIISTTAEGAANLISAGASAYWKQPQSGAHVTERSFGKTGRQRTPVVRLPTVPGADHLVLLANLAAPSEGGDSRALTVPLKLDYSHDPANPIAQPIGVRLGENGWQVGP